MADRFAGITSLIGSVSTQTDSYRIKEKRILVSAMIIFKVILAGLFSSDFQDNMFIPFVDCFLSGKDPYAFFYEKSLPQSFPYFPLMLYIESIGGLLIMMAGGSVFLRNLLFKAPLFLFDFITYMFIGKMGMRFKYAYVFYSMSPILLYGTYMHGQLDIIPTAILVVAVYYITSWRRQINLVIGSVILGLALSTKFHIIAAVPLLAIYVVKKKDIRWCCESLLITMATVFLISFPFIGEGFYNTVLQNNEQSVLLTVGIEYGVLKVLLPLFAVLLIYAKAYDLDYFNRELLISMLGMLFAVFLICIPSSPAWFTWIIPFVALYFGYISKGKYKAIGVYFIFNLVYLIYFVFLYHTQYTDLYFLGSSLQNLKINNDEIRNIGFTILVTLLAVIIYKVFQSGIESNGLYQRGDMPFTIGISGDSGTGKSRMIEKIQDLFGNESDVLTIEGDGDHRWERNDEKWNEFTALDPKANYLYKQANDIRDLRRGNRVNRRDYDHDFGVFTEEKRYRPKKYMVISGLHVLYLPQLRNELDLKIYMDTDTKLQKFWKIRRDVSVRGHKIDEIMAEIDRRTEDAQRYILPQKQYADIIITYYDPTLYDCMDAGHKEDISVKFCMPLSYDMEEVISKLAAKGISVSHTITNDFQMQDIDVQCSGIDELSIDFEMLAEELIPQYEDLFNYPPRWRKGMEGVIQIILMKVISQKMIGESR